MSAYESYFDSSLWDVLSIFPGSPRAPPRPHIIRPETLDERIERLARLIYFKKFYPPYKCIAESFHEIRRITQSLHDNGREIRFNEIHQRLAQCIDKLETVDTQCIDKLETVDKSSEHLTQSLTERIDGMAKSILRYQDEEKERGLRINRITQSFHEIEHIAQSIEIDMLHQRIKHVAQSIEEAKELDQRIERIERSAGIEHIAQSTEIKKLQQRIERIAQSIEIAKFQQRIERITQSIDEIKELDQPNERAERFEHTEHIAQSIDKINQQMHSLRHRQASLHSHLWENTHPERLEDEKTYYHSFNGVSETARAKAEFFTLDKWGGWVQQHQSCTENKQMQSMIRAYDIESGDLRKKDKPDLLVEQMGLRVLINNRKYAAFGDTGAGQNIISDRRRKELGLEMRPQRISFPMGNSKRIYSSGTVELSLAFEDDPTNIIPIVAYVVYNFAYDLLLGNRFLQKTECFILHRFVPCLFSLVSKWSFNLLGETTHRFKGTLGNGVNILGLPDIGSVRNVMDAEWASNMAQTCGFEILSQPENCGLVLFPDGTKESTIGQVHTTMTLEDGKVVPLVFELLPHCHVPVVFGQQFVFDHDIYSRYSASVLEVESPDSGDELMPINWTANKGEKKKKRSDATLPQDGQENDQNRQLRWNIAYEDGRTATVEEWNEENDRREEYERQQNPNWQPSRPLILYAAKQPSPEPTSSAVRDNDSSSSSADGNSRLVDSSSSSLEITHGQNNIPNPWDKFHLGGLPGFNEADQWAKSQSE